MKKVVKQMKVCLKNVTAVFKVGVGIQMEVTNKQIWGQAKQIKW